MQTRRVFRLGLLALLAVVCFPVAGLYAYMWHARLSAHRMLAVARTIHPGITTQAEFEDVVKPWRGSRTEGWEGEAGRPTITTESYYVTNQPESLGWIVSRLPQRVGEWLFDHRVFAQSALLVSPRFEDGRVGALHVEVFQDGVDGIHPFCAIVKLYAHPYEDHEVSLTGRFYGYQVIRMETSREDDSGRPIGSSWLTRQYVTLDDRASNEQRRRALDFNLAGFTSILGYRSAEPLLHPVPEVDN